MSFLSTSHTHFGSGSKQQEWTYEKIGPAENASVLEDSCSQDLSIDPESCRGSSKRGSLLVMINSILFFSSLAFLAITIRLRNSSESESDAFQRVNGFSPIFKEMNIQFKDVQLNGTLYPSKNPSFSRKEPGDPEAEAVWASLENFDVFPISREDVIGIGKDPETAVKFPNELFGLGDEAFVASLDISHKLHCLNTLRKLAFNGYVPYGGGEVHYKDDQDALYHGLRKHGELWWYHLRHCVDMLARALICHATPDLITYNWRDTQTHAFFDFSINQKCINFEQIQEYREQHKVDLDKYVDLVRYGPNGTTRLLPYEKQFYNMYGFTGSILFPDGQGVRRVFCDT